MGKPGQRKTGAAAHTTPADRKHGEPNAGAQVLFPPFYSDAEPQPIQSVSSQFTFASLETSPSLVPQLIPDAVRLTITINHHSDCYEDSNVTRIKGIKRTTAAFTRVQRIQIQTDLLCIVIKDLGSKGGMRLPGFVLYTVFLQSRGHAGGKQLVMAEFRSSGRD